MIYPYDSNWISHVAWGTKINWSDAYCPYGMQHDACPHVFYWNKAATLFTTRLLLSSNSTPGPATASEIAVKLRTWKWISFSVLVTVGSCAILVPCRQPGWRESPRHRVWSKKKAQEISTAHQLQHDSNPLCQWFSSSSDQHTIKQGIVENRKNSVNIWMQHRDKWSPAAVLGVTSWFALSVEGNNAIWVPLREPGWTRNTLKSASCKQKVRLSSFFRGRV